MWRLERLQMIDRHFADVNDVLRLKKPLKSLEREPVLIESSRIEILFSRGKIFLDAFGERRSSQRVRLDLRH
jgi:hypothetical protein